MGPRWNLALVQSMPLAVGLTLLGDGCLEASPLRVLARQAWSRTCEWALSPKEDRFEAAVRHAVEEAGRAGWILENGFWEFGIPRRLKGPAVAFLKSVPQLQNWEIRSVEGSRAHLLRVAKAFAERAPVVTGLNQKDPWPLKIQSVLAGETGRFTSGFSADLVMIPRPSGTRLPVLPFVQVRLGESQESRSHGIRTQAYFNTLSLKPRTAEPLDSEYARPALAATVSRFYNSQLDLQFLHMELDYPGEGLLTREHHLLIRLIEHGDPQKPLLAESMFFYKSFLTLLMAREPQLFGQGP